LRLLVSTFASGDADKVLRAMRSLPYERLVLVGVEGIEASAGCRRLRNLEEMAGHEVLVELVKEDDFMELVDQVSDALVKLAKDARTGSRNSLILNISGGSKLLGDAALLAAFRLGVEAYHCEERITKLPVINGATAKDRFTSAQVQFLDALGEDWVSLDQVTESMIPANRSAVERVMRDLRRDGILNTDVRDGKIFVALSEVGAEVAWALRLTHGE